MYRAESGGAEVNLISNATTANTEVATGVLAGTTGTDVKVTVSPHTNGNIYIENRSGATRVFFVKQISGVL
jgi:hypothetical protein